MNRTSAWKVSTVLGELWGIRRALRLVISDWQGFAEFTICNSAVSDVTRILEAVRRGEAQPADELLPVVYAELRSIAASKMAQEKPGHTLQATILVHDAWRSLFPEGGHQGFEGSAHFFAAAAEAMRRILVDHARRKRSLKRGGAVVRVEGKQSQEVEMVQPAPTEELLAVDEVLDKFKAADETAANVVLLRYFVGMKMEEAAASLGISKREAERSWTYARSWLRREIGKELGI